MLVGKAAVETADAEQPGLWIRGDVAELDVDAWLALDSRPSADASAASPAAGLALNGVDLTAGTLDALSRRFTKLKTSARRQGGEWRLTLDGTELAGTAVWRAATPAQPNGRMTPMKRVRSRDSSR